MSDFYICVSTEAESDEVTYDGVGNPIYLKKVGPLSDTSMSMAQGVATEVLEGSDESIKDNLGYTNPNLHRRIDVQDLDSTTSDELELAPRQYQLNVGGYNSYRTTEKITYIDYQITLDEAISQGYLPEGASQEDFELLKQRISNMEEREIP